MGEGGVVKSGLDVVGARRKAESHNGRKPDTRAWANLNEETVHCGQGPQQRRNKQALKRRGSA